MQSFKRPREGNFKQTRGWKVGHCQECSVNMGEKQKEKLLASLEKKGTNSKWQKLEISKS